MLVILNKIIKFFNIYIREDSRRKLRIKLYNISIILE